VSAPEWIADQPVDQHSGNVVNGSSMMLGEAGQTPGVLGQDLPSPPLGTVVGGLDDQLRPATRLPASAVYLHAWVMVTCFFLSGSIRACG
jgi:hypothetical protein